MPIRYSFDNDEQLIRTVVTGELNTPDTLEYFAALASDPDCPSDAIEIVDFSAVTDFSLQFAQMYEITHGYEPTRATRMITATLFHCPSDLAFGIGRMLQSLHEMVNPDHITHVARTEEELKEFIALLRPTG